MGVNDVATDFRSSPVDRGPEMRAKARTESKFECDDENGGDRAKKTPEIERKRVKRIPNRSDNDKAASNLLNRLRTLHDVMLTLTPPILKPSKSTVKKKAPTPSIARFLSHTTEGNKRNKSLVCPKKKAMGCNDMEVVFMDDRDVKEVGGDEESVEKEKSKQQLEAVSIKEPLNNELSDDEKRGCVLQSSPQTVVADTQNNTKDEEMCNTNGVVINKDEKKRNYSTSSCYSEGTKEESQMVKLNGEQDTVVAPLRPVKKKVKVMVEKENREWIGGRKSSDDVNVTSVESAKQDIETPKAVAVMTDDEDCSEGGSVEEDKLKFSIHDVMTDGGAYNIKKRKINNRSSIIEESAPATIGMTMTTTPISDLKVESNVYISLDQVDTIVVTPQKISATTTTDSSSASTPATTISAPEIDTDASIHNKPSCCLEEVTKSPVVTINSGSGGLSTEIMHYELQLEEAVSLFEKIYKERPDNILGLVDALDYAIQEEGKKLMLKDDQQQQQHFTDDVSSSNENSSFSSFPDVLCPALSCIIQGDGSRLDTLASMAFQTITVALEERRCSSSSSNKNISAAIDTLLHNMTETNVMAKIQLLAVRRTYGTPPPNATVTSLEDKTPSACWIWEVQCIEALPGNKLNQAIVRRVRADRKKVGDWVRSLHRLLTTLENHPLVASRVASDTEKVMKCARAIETAIQKKRALKLAQERKLQENEEKEKEKFEKKQQKIAEKDAVKAKREAEKGAKMDAKRQKAAEKLQIVQKSKTDEKPRISLLNFFTKTATASPRTVDLSSSSTAVLSCGGENPPSSLGLSTGAGPDVLTGAVAANNMKKFCANLFSNMPFDELLAETRRLNDSKNGERQSCGYRQRGRSKSLKLEVHVEGAPTIDNNNFTDVTYIESKQVCVRGPMKALQFHEDLRPAYWGTCSGHSRMISGRRPIVKDTSILDYSVDSEAEWEVEPEGGEELVSEEDEGGAGVENEPDGLDYEDGWLKHDEDALIFSGDEGEVNNNNDECDNNANANAADPKYAGFQITQNRSIVGVRYIEDGQLVPSALIQQRAVVLAVDDGEPIPAAAARDGRPYSFISLDNTLSATANSSALGFEKTSNSVDQPKGVIEKKTGKPKPFLPEHLPLLVEMLHGSPLKKNTIISEFVTAHPEVGKKALAQMITSIATKEASVNKLRVWVVKEAIFQQLNSANNVTKEDHEGVPIDQLSPIKGQKSLHDFIDPGATAAAVQSKT